MIAWHSCAALKDAWVIFVTWTLAFSIVYYVHNIYSTIIQCNRKCKSKRSSSVTSTALLTHSSSTLAVEGQGISLIPRLK